MAAPPSVPCILHLDADAFFASVEQRDDPRLRGKPVAVGTGVVASCSYESRRWGVRTAMRLADAKRLCPPLIVLPGDYRRYEQAARRMLAVCLEFTPRVEAAANVVVAPADDPDMPTRWFVQGCAAIHSSVSWPSAASSA